MAASTPMLFITIFLTLQISTITVSYGGLESLILPFVLPIYLTELPVSQMSRWIGLYVMLLWSLPFTTKTSVSLLYSYVLPQTPMFLLLATVLTFMLRFWKWVRVMDAQRGRALREEMFVPNGFIEVMFAMMLWLVE